MQIFGNSYMYMRKGERETTVVNAKVLQKGWSSFPLCVKCSVGIRASSLQCFAVCGSVSSLLVLKSLNNGRAQDLLLLLGECVCWRLDIFEFSPPQLQQKEFCFCCCSRNPFQKLSAELCCLGWLLLQLYYFTIIPAVFKDRCGPSIWAGVRGRGRLEDAPSLGSTQCPCFCFKTVWSICFWSGDRPYVFRWD